MNQPRREITEIQKDVFKGNVDSYHELRDAYLDSFPGDFLYWAIFMANKHRYPNAYYDVYICLVQSYGGGDDNFHKMDNETQKFALKYLRLASDNGVVQAREIYKKIKQADQFDGNLEKRAR